MSMLDAPEDRLQAECELIVQQLQAGDDAGQQRLYDLFEPGVRYFLARQLRREEIEDKVHDTFVAVVTAILAGQLLHAVSLPAFVKTVAQRQVMSYIRQTTRPPPDPADIEWQQSGDPEHELIEREEEEFARRVLEGLPEVDRQILRRFYVEGQSAEEICQAMKMTPTQFRLRKYRAKRRFAELTQEGLKRHKRERFRKKILRKAATSSH
jgi:RNA polymerase sigma-70 factor (ECF subfamily)